MLEKRICMIVNKIAFVLSLYAMISHLKKYLKYFSGAIVKRWATITLFSDIIKIVNKFYRIVWTFTPNVRVSRIVCLSRVISRLSSPSWSSIVFIWYRYFIIRIMYVNTKEDYLPKLSYSQNIILVWSRRECFKAGLLMKVLIAVRFPFLFLNPDGTELPVCGERKSSANSRGWH